VCVCVDEREGWETKRIDDVRPKGETKREDAPTRPKRAKVMPIGEK